MSGFEFLDTTDTEFLDTEDTEFLDVGVGLNPPSNIGIFNPADHETQRLMLAKHFPKGIFWNAVFDLDKNTGKLVSGLSHEYYRLASLVKILFDEMDILLTDQKLVDWERSVGIPDNCFNITNTTKAQRRINVEQKFANFNGIQTADDIKGLAALYGLTVKIYPGGSYFTEKTISSLTSVGTTATAITTTPHGYIDGLEITHSGADQTEYNIEASVDVIDLTTYSYTFVGSGTSPATGTIKANYKTDKVRKHTIVIKPIASVGTTSFPLPFPVPFETDEMEFFKCLLETLVPANVDVITV